MWSFYKIVQKPSTLSIIWIAYTRITNTILTPKLVCLQASQINFMIQDIHLWLKLDTLIHKHFTVFNIAFSHMGSGLLAPFLIDDTFCQKLKLQSVTVEETEAILYLLHRD